MKTIKVIFFFSYYCLLSFGVMGQDLAMRKLTDIDMKNKVYRAYEYNGTDHYAALKLTLYHDKTFYYTLKTFYQDVFSKGNWIQRGDTLILENSIKNGHVPIKLLYSNDSSNLINGFRVAIVRNLKGEEMPDGLVAINNDSNICLPSYGGVCRGEYTSIDSIKIVFENGLSSEWFEVGNCNCKEIIPVVQTHFLISSYMVFDKRKYLIRKSILKPIN